MSIKFLVLGGGVFWVWGGEVPILFYGRGDFSESVPKTSSFGSCLVPQRTEPESEHGFVRAVVLQLTQAMPKQCEKF